jgi:hypothetical protein
MATNERAPLGDGALPELITGFAGSADAVASCEDIIAMPTPSTCLVDVLCHLIWRLLPWLQEVCP